MIHEQMNLKRLILYTLVFALLPSVVKSEVKLPALFSDHMVLQQQSNVAIWGWAKKGSTVTVTASWSKKASTTKTDTAGKWKIFITTPGAGGPYKITVTDGMPLLLDDIMIGEVWLCSGQSNMEMPMKGFKGQPVLESNEEILHARNKNIRVITVPRASSLELLEDFKGHWEQASPVSIAEFSATAYYFGKLLNEILDVPVGLLHVSYSGSTIEAWMDASWLKEFDIKGIPAKGDSIHTPNRTPTLLFNGMLHPVVGYSIKGCIWYQGESNYTDPDLYEKLFEKMVKEWRTQWGLGDFPFYYAQIAPFNYAQFPQEERKEKYNSGYLRDAQRKAMKNIPNSGMAVLMDTGEKDNIHPANKKAAGHRLAYWALSKTYDVQGFTHASPSYDRIEIKDSTIIISFADAPNGITSFGETLTYFEIAGKDKKFYPATATLGRKSVTVSSPQVKEPVAVRYAFKDFVKGDLFGTSGLPVSSFRSDDW
jgi:sialate O-acetylesterase